MQRIDRLEKTISHMALVLDDAGKKVGPDLHIRTHHSGTNESGAVVVSLQAQIYRVAKIGRDVL